MKGGLRALVEARAARARARGALEPIETECEIVASGGVDFAVRVVSSVRREDAASPDRARNPERDPFLPYEEDLFVADLSGTHVCLLNKFNVLDAHLLVVTRAFAEQGAPLDDADFEALAVCMREIDGLGFYNAGPVAGASQRHKHLQLVPFPLAPASPRPPIERLLERVPARGGGPHVVSGLAFVHALAWIDPARVEGATLLSSYDTLLGATGLRTASSTSRLAGLPLRPPLPPYNLLVTRSWMLLVPRLVPAAGGVPVNALGFAGALLARDRAQLEWVRETGPMQILARVGKPW